MKRKLLAAAIGIASGSIAVGASAAITPSDMGLHFADELLTDQRLSPNVITSDDLVLVDVLGSGTVQQDDQFFRFDLTNAEFEIPRDDGDFRIGGVDTPPGAKNLISGGSRFSNFAVYGVVHEGQGFDPEQRFGLDLDALRWLDKSQPITVEMCRYDEDQDATNPGDDDEAPIDCRTWTVATAKTGLSYMCEKDPNPIANVSAFYGNYKNFTEGGPRDFGNCTIESSALNTMGELADISEYFDRGTKLSVSASGLDGWVDLSSDDSYLKEGTNCRGRERSVNLGDDFGAVDTLHAGLFDWGSSLDDDSLTFSVCLDDVFGGNHEPIPITDPLIVSVGGNTTAAFPGGVEDHVAGISRNGIVLRAPFITTNEAVVQRLILTNRGPIDAEYGVTCTPEDVGDGKVDVDYLDGAHGVIPAHETIKVFTREFGGQPGVVEFDNGDGFLGACVITVAGKFSEIDGVVTTKILDSGATDSQNMTNDEGYVETTPDILPLDKEDEDDGEPEES